MLQFSSKINKDDCRYLKRNVDQTLRFKRCNVRVSKKSRNPLFSLILPSFLYGKPFARRWTCQSSGLGIVRFVQTDFPTSCRTLYSGTMRWRYSWGGDALWVSRMFIFENQWISLMKQFNLLRKIGRGCQRSLNKRAFKKF